MKKTKILSIITILLLFTSMFTVLTVQGATEPEIEESIDKGVAWIAANQNLDGSWGAYANEAMTSFALIKLQDYAWEHGISPFDDTYEYYAEVRDGWAWLLPNVKVSTLGLQDHTGGASGTNDDPDTRANGIGLSVAFGSWEVYSTGIFLMALEASQSPGKDSGHDYDLDFVPDSFFDVAQDTADWLAFVQGDAFNDEGGWGYDLHDNQASDQWTDNSVSGYAVLGLAAAESFGCTVPDWVKTELKVWISTIQDPVDGDSDDGGSYYNPDWLPWDPWVNELKAGNLIFQITFVGDKATQRFTDAMDYMTRLWQHASVDPGWGYTVDPAGYQPMYCLMKGLEYSQTDTIDLSGIGGSSTHDWYDEFSTVIVAQQNPDGSWDASGHGDDMLSTFWALLTLEKVTPEPPVIEAPVDIKPGSWPNPFNKDAKGVFAVAICGTEDFDVTTIDPLVALYFDEIVEGDPTATPIRWTYEDVATPYATPNPDDPEGHDLEGDGYLDLVFHFSRQEVTGLTTCEEADKSYWKLYLTGNLMEEYGGTSFTGFDWIRIQMSKGKNK